MSNEAKNNEFRKCITKNERREYSNNHFKGFAYKLLEPWLGQSLLISHSFQLLSKRDRWRPKRKLLTPTSHYDILKDFVPVFNEQAKILVQKMGAANGKLPSEDMNSGSAQNIKLGIGYKQDYSEFWDQNHLVSEFGTALIQKLDKPCTPSLIVLNSLIAPNQNGLNTLRSSFFQAALASGGTVCRYNFFKNIPTYPVLELNFSQCKTTEDGEYLIPNGVRTTKIESSRIKEIEDHHDNFRSVLQARQNSIAVGVEIPIFGPVSIGGSLSAEFINIKKTMTRLNTDLNTLNLVYEAYEMVANDGQMKVIDSFQHEIQGIANALNRGRPRMAEYLAQMTVKQYGTHFVTKSIMGASLEYLEYVESDDGSSFSNEGASTSVGIGISVPRVSFGVSGTNSKTNIKETERSSRIRHTDEFRKGNFTFTRNTNDNGAEIYTNLVVEDIVGLRFHVKRLSEVLSKKTFPQYSLAVLEAVKEKLDSAIIAYYQANVIRGCTNPKAVNFNFQANDDDGSCKIVPIPYFGGAYGNMVFKFVDQQNSRFGNGVMEASERAVKTELNNNPDYRDSFFADNPITGQPSCPFGFESILLYESNSTVYFKEKPWFGLDHEDGNATAIRIRNADKDVSFRLHRKYGVYWCKRDRSLPPPKDSDIALFGGVYKGLY
ncbi:hypothetical protein WR25_05583 [Diploscapter pachys]|uniref:MACPF domain-containing protein n=1 Tax=Diploscapter pachys TaxID=2018661 RepID=A0A2A2LT32_9BILA|nr:hypothetical protein WR25_05583 [Diploscapter pachys]